MKEGPIREYASDGTLTGAGFVWSEYLPRMKTLGYSCLLVAPIVTIFIWFMNGDKAIPVLFLGLGFAVIGGLILYFLTRNKRSVIFRIDGSMATPQGLPDYWRVKTIKGHYNDISSIASRIDGDMNRALNAHNYHEVVLFSTQGNIICLANSINGDRAHMVATQLTIALAAIRKVASETALKQRMQIN